MNTIVQIPDLLCLQCEGISGISTARVPGVGIAKGYVNALMPIIKKQDVGKFIIKILNWYVLK